MTDKKVDMVVNEETEYIEKWVEVSSIIDELYDIHLFGSPFWHWLDVIITDLCKTDLSIREIVKKVNQDFGEKIRGIKWK